MCKSRGNKDRPNISLQTGRHPSSQVLRHSGLHLIHLAGTDTTLCDHRTPPEVPNTLTCLLKTLPSSMVTFFAEVPPSTLIKPNLLSLVTAAPFRKLSPALILPFVNLRHELISKQLSRNLIINVKEDFSLWRKI